VDEHLVGICIKSSVNLATPIISVIFTYELNRETMKPLITFLTIGIRKPNRNIKKKDVISSQLEIELQELVDEYNDRQNKKKKKMSDLF
jgi:hypothetical protein